MRALRGLSSATRHTSSNLSEGAVVEDTDGQPRGGRGRYERRERAGRSRREAASKSWSRVHPVCSPPDVRLRGAGPGARRGQAPVETGRGPVGPGVPTGRDRPLTPRAPSGTVTGPPRPLFRPLFPRSIRARSRPGKQSQGGPEGLKGLLDENRTCGSSNPLVPRRRLSFECKKRRRKVTKLHRLEERRRHTQHALIFFSI